MQTTKWKHQVINYTLIQNETNKAISIPIQDTLKLEPEKKKDETHPTYNN